MGGGEVGVGMGVGVAVGVGVGQNGERVECKVCSDMVGVFFSQKKYKIHGSWPSWV